MRELTLAEIKQTELEILEYIDRVCKENDIEYFLFAGTLLGAVRHKGFIPWDDDIDLMMTRENYDKFIWATKHNSGRYKVFCFANDSGYYSPYVKVADNTTIAYDTINKNSCEMGVWVDVFPLDNYVEDFKNAAKRHKEYRKFSFSLRQKFHKDNYGAVKNLIRRCIFAFYHPQSPRKFMVKVEKLAQKYNNQQTSKIFMGVDAVAEKGNVMEKSWIEKTVLVSFEGKEYPAPAEYDKVLTAKFGDYMTPPPEDKRVTHNYYKFYSKND